MTSRDLDSGQFFDQRLERTRRQPAKVAELVQEAVQRPQAGRGFERVSELRVAASSSARKSSRSNRSTSTTVLHRTVAVRCPPVEQRRLAEHVARAQRRQRHLAVPARSP